MNQDWNKVYEETEEVNELSIKILTEKKTGVKYIISFTTKLSDD